MTVLALSGGIGGAKLALGLYRALPPGELAVLCNTGDDFEHLGLHISPDIDTILYTLSGLADPERGWGRAEESWRFMSALAEMGGDTWFQLGDRDLALHVERSRRLRAGETLSAITGDIARRLSIGARIIPMSDTPVPTVVMTEGGPLLFQHYFVRERCEPRVTGFDHAGAEAAMPPPDLAAVLEAPGLRAIVVCPSNPFISIDPILAVPGVRHMLAAAGAPVIAVSPIVGGQAIKGPTAKMMDELGLPRSAAAIAARYAGLIDGFILDEADAASAADIEALGPAVRVAQTVMRTLDDRVSLAETVLAFADALAKTQDSGEAA